MSVTTSESRMLREMWPLPSWSEAAGIKCLSDVSCKTQEAYVGTIDFGKFLDDLDVSTNMAGYVSSKRGCVVLDEDQKVTYTWAGMPDQLPDVTEIQAALGIGKCCRMHRTSSAGRSRSVGLANM